MADIQVAIVGASPYGLAVSAFLRGVGVESRTFGRPMESWHHNMPAGMLLRSAPRSSHIADPQRALGLDAWSAETGGDSSYPIKVEDFIAYGRWFQEKAVPELDPRMVRRVVPTDAGLALTLDDGSALEADRVIVAAGIRQFAARPEVFEGSNPDLVTHSFQHEDLSRFAGRRVLVVGGGQSALETAALLAESGASTRLIARTEELFWLQPFAFLSEGLRARMSELIRPPTDLGGRITGWLAAAPGAFRHLPPSVQAITAAQCTKPAGAPWLRSRLTEVPLDLGHEVVRVEEEGDGSLTVAYDDGTEHTVDHAILCTGYRVDISRYEFLSPQLLDRLEMIGGAPRLSRGLEASIPGLYFAGAPAAASFGPIMRFVVGTWYAAPTIASHISGKRRRPAHLSYRPRI